MIHISISGLDFFIFPLKLSVPSDDFLSFVDVLKMYVSCPFFSAYDEEHGVYVFMFGTLDEDSEGEVEND